MRHLKAGRKLGVSATHRKAMMRSMTLALIEREKIKTTPARAKAVRSLAERVVTLAKRDNLGATRRLVQLLGSNRTKRIGQNRIRLAITKLHKTLAPRFVSRDGGYTQIIRTMPWRVGDGAEMCILQYIPEGATKKAAPKDKKSGKKKLKAAPKKAKKPEDKPSRATKVPEDKPGKVKKTQRKSQKKG